jgi:hypothetical protein
MEWESNCLSHLFAAGFVLVLQEQEGSGPLAVRSGINQPRHNKCGSNTVVATDRSQSLTPAAVLEEKDRSLLK